MIRPDWFTIACTIIREPEPDEVLEGFDRLIGSLDRQAVEAARLADELAASLQTHTEGGMR